MTNQNYLMIL